MKQPNIKIWILAAMAGSLITTNANAECPSAYSKQQGKPAEAKQVRPFRGRMPWTADSPEFMPNLKNSRRHAAVDEPAVEFQKLGQYDYLEGPDGTTWFYTAEYETESIVWSEWYTQENIIGYKFTIYDSTFSKIGEIKDKITLKEGETGVAHAVLDPAVSRKFFNRDNNPEVMVYIAVNTEMYVNVYYNKVYSIGGEKDTDGNDISLMMMDGRCVDAFNAALPGEEENYFYTFAGDETADLEADYDNFVDFVNSYIYPVTTYGKANGENGPVVLQTKNIYLTRIPGDTTDGIYFISKPINGQPYFIYSQYEKPFLVDPTGMATDESMTPDNSLVIEVYTYEGGMLKPVSTTSIPVDAAHSSEALMYTFYSIGSVAWKHDIDMSVNGTTSAPAFIVARDVINAATYEEVVSTYGIYGNDGKLIKNIAQDTDGLILFDTDGTAEPEALFVSFDENGVYTFKVGTLYSGNTRFTLNQNNDGDPISASCNRMTLSNGKYSYGFEMTYYDQDEEGNEYIRVAWFDHDGNFDHIDKINVGKDIMAAAVNLYSDSLDPHLYDADDQMEYAVLVKRINGPTTRNEFIVADDNGEWLARFTEDDGKGTPYMYAVVPGADFNSIMMVYKDAREYNIDIYPLPFANGSGIENVTSGGMQTANLEFDGETASAPNCDIEIYTTGGVKVASGHGKVSLRTLTSGIYIAVVKDAEGNAASIKIARR